MIVNVPTEYSERYIETKKCRPFMDKSQQNLIRGYDRVSYWPLDTSYAQANILRTENIFPRFIETFTQHITESKLNSILNLNHARRVDTILGCTQYIDNLHLQFPKIQVLEKEYVYHTKLRVDTIISTVETLVDTIPLVISVPFSLYGKTHPLMDKILSTCLEKSIPVHLDCAWVTACKNIHVDFSHPAVHSVGFSLSKGYGLSGWNRVGLRYKKDTIEDSITVMNDNLQIPSLPFIVGQYFMDNLKPDHLWNTHSDRHYKICRDFNLESTDTIHMATKDNKVLGIAPLLGYLEHYDL